MVEPLIVIMAGARASTHIPSMKILEFSKIPEKTIRNTFKEINTIAIYYAMSIILHKRKIENNEPLPLDTQPPKTKIKNSDRLTTFIYRESNLVTQGARGSGLM